MSSFPLTISAAQSGTAYTSALNNALTAINTCHSGGTAPTTNLAAGKFWLDTSGTPILKIYDGSTWKSVITLNTGSGTNLTSIASLSGTAATFTGTVTAGDFNTTSDARLKTDIKDIPDALNKVEALRGVYFTMDGREQVGVIAQEVEAVVPELVNTNQVGYKTVAYSNTVGLLIEAVKEQSKKIEELTKRIEELEK